MKVEVIVNYFFERKWILLFLCVVTVGGFAFKFYSGPGHKWFNEYGAGVLYEVFWCLAVFFFMPRKKCETRIAIIVFVITSVLETLQLWHPPFLQSFRSTFLGAALLGTTFVWWDFPHYVLGCIIGWLLMRMFSEI